MPYAPIIRILQSENFLPSELPKAVLADLKQLAPQLAFHAADIPANPPLDPYAEQQRLFESLFALLATLAWTAAAGASTGPVVPFSRFDTIP